MSHILIPTDFSDNALNAATFAVQLFGDEGNRYTLLNCYVAPTSSVSPMWNVDGLMAQEALDGTSQFADKLRVALPGLQPELSTAVEHGPLPQVVGSYAAEADRPVLVAMGTQDASGLEAVL
ncbi:MAG TPA: universal stress protein, partial [Flavobacteriales bacterium]|nr:universal stress protein [Flavobacteriales bacterium]